MKHLKQFESVFAEFDNLLQIHELEKVYQELQKLINDKKFMKFDADTTQIYFNDIKVILDQQLYTRLIHMLKMNSDGEIIVKKGHQDGIGVAVSNMIVSTYTLNNVKDVDDAVDRLKDFVIKLHTAYVALNSTKQHLNTAKDAILQLPAENTDYKRIVNNEVS